MRERVEFIELTSLEKTGKDRWKFRIEQNSSFISMFETLWKAHVFEAKSVYWPGDNDQYYLVNDEGIWLLSHVFSNWDEMYEQTNKKSPWEENWQKRAEQDTPPEHVNCKCDTGQEESEHCALCGEELHTDYIHCGTCNKPLCSFCDEAHQRTHKEYCAGCAKLYYRDVLETCKDCGKKFCLLCMFEHKKKHEARQRHGFDYYYRLYQNGIWNKAQFDEYINEQQSKTKQGEWKQQSYSSAYSTQNINLDDLREIFENMKTWQWQHPGDAERATGAEEERKRKQAHEEARQREEFFRNFRYNPGQQSSSNSQSSSPPHKRPVLTSEIRAAFQLFGLPPVATEQEIKRKFRVLAKTAHPDAGGSEQAFKKLNDAYEKTLAYAKENKGE